MNCVFTSFFGYIKDGGNYMDPLVKENINKLLELARQNIYSNPDQGRGYLNEAMSLSKRYDDPHGIAWSTLRLGSYKYRDGQALDAIECYKEALTMFQKLKDYQGIVRGHYLTATVYALISQYDLALNHYLEALPIAKTYDETYYGRLLNNLANTYHDLKSYDKATEMALKSLAYMKENDTAKVYLAYSTLGEVYLAQEDFKKALGFAEKALESLEASDNKAYKGICNMIIAGAYKGLTYFDEALIVYNRALQFMEDAGNLQNISEIHRNIGDIYAIKKEYQYAFKHLQTSMTSAIKQESLLDQSKTYYVYADLYEKLDNHKKALDSFKHAVSYEKQYLDHQLKDKYKAIQVSEESSETPEITDSLKLTLGELRSTYLNLKKLEQTKLTDAFVEVVVDTIDVRDTTTSGHSKRLAKYALEMMKRINLDDQVFKTIYFDENDMKAMYYAALLHDIGKLSVLESILLKTRRLSEDKMKVIEERLYNIKACLNNKKDKGQLTDDEKSLDDKIMDYFSFVESLVYANTLEQDQILKLQEIHKEEVIDCQGRVMKLIDADDLKRLSVKRGNLIASEWTVIRKHADYTKKILKEIPWLKDMTQVPELAGSHHEKLDGSGYPLGLAGNEISISVRILTIVDIFEALTASDRPYKDAMSIEEALNVLKEEAQEGKLDMELVDFFIKEKISHLCEKEIYALQAGH